MILIISSEEDNSTNLVIRWLKYFNKSFIRINGTTNVSLSKLIVSDTETDFESKSAKIVNFDICVSIIEYLKKMNTVFGLTINPVIIILILQNGREKMDI